MDFAVLEDYRKNESKMINKYLHFAWELRKLWNIKVTMILIIAGVLGTVTKDMEKKFG